MRIVLDRSGTSAGLQAALQDVGSAPGVGTLLVLACDADGHSPATLDPVLHAAPHPVIGGVFPQIIHERETLTHGTLVLGVPAAARVHVVHGLSRTEEPLEAAVAAVADARRTNSLVMVVADAFATRLADLVRALFAEHGLEHNYIGGGAGSLSMQQAPCVITPDGLVEDAAVFAQFAMPSGVGVAHGWSVISEPLRVTRSRGAIIEELNYEPALDVYRRVVEPRAGRSVTAEHFFDVAKAYPFGVRKLDAEVVVRDPIAIEASTALRCVGEVPKGAFVHILHGQPDALVAAVREASVRAITAWPGRKPPALRLVIDCISRALFQGEEFGRELAALGDGPPTVGALTLGEIANSGRDFLEFYNKTIVVGLIADG
jgi:hypothetical protein